MRRLVTPFFGLLWLLILAAWLLSYTTRYPTCAAWKNGYGHYLLSREGSLFYIHASIPGSGIPYPSRWDYSFWIDPRPPRLDKWGLPDYSHPSTLEILQDNSRDFHEVFTNYDPSYCDPWDYRLPGNCLGVGTSSLPGNWAGDPPKFTFFFLRLPYWLLLLLATYPLLRPLVRLVPRFRHKPCSGLCLVCGYDLRAHAPGQRCPECGTLVPPPTPAAPPSKPWYHPFTPYQLQRRHTMLTRFLRRNVYWLLLVAILLMVIQYQAMRLANARRPILPAPIFVAENQNLAKPVTLNFDATPLHKVLSQWSTETGYPFNPLWPVLKKNDIDPNTPITLKVDHPIPLSQAFTLLKKESGLEYDITGTQVEISTAEDLLERPLTHVFYPVHDIITPHDLHDDVRPEERRDLLIGLIQGSVDPTSWRDNGGQMGSIRPYGDLLSIVTLHRNHIQIAQLLETLRANPVRLGNSKQ